MTPSASGCERLIEDVSDVPRLFIVLISDEPPSASIFITPRIRKKINMALQVGKI